MPPPKAPTGQRPVLTAINLSAAEQIDLLADRWVLIAAALSPYVLVPAREVAEVMAVCVRTMGLISQRGPLEYLEVLQRWREATAPLEDVLATQNGRASSSDRT